MIFNFSRLLLIFIVLSGCKPQHVSYDKAISESKDYDLTIAFGSCNNQDSKNLLWDDILKNKPDLWIWAGDNIYSDTNDMRVLKNSYKRQMGQDGYAEFVKKVKILGTWDDHDFGKNDAGVEYPKRIEVKSYFLIF